MHVGLVLVPEFLVDELQKYPLEDRLDQFLSKSTTGARKSNRVTRNSATADCKNVTNNGITNAFELSFNSNTSSRSLSSNQDKNAMVLGRHTIPSISTIDDMPDRLAEIVSKHSESTQQQGAKRSQGTDDDGQQRLVLKLFSPQKLGQVYRNGEIIGESRRDKRKFAIGSSVEFDLNAGDILSIGVRAPQKRRICSYLVRIHDAVSSDNRKRKPSLTRRNSNRAKENGQDQESSSVDESPRKRPKTAAAIKESPVSILSSSKKKKKSISSTKTPPSSTTRRQKRYQSVDTPPAAAAASPQNSEMVMVPRSMAVAIAEDLTCPLCLDVLVQATTLVPCGHSFCASCLKKLETQQKSNNNSSSQFACAYCQSNVETQVVSHVLNQTIAKLMAVNGRGDDGDNNSNKKESPNGAFFPPGDEEYYRQRLEQQQSEDNKLKSSSKPPAKINARRYETRLQGSHTLSHGAIGSPSLIPPVGRSNRTFPGLEPSGIIDVHLPSVANPRNHGNAVHHTVYTLSGPGFARRGNNNSNNNTLNNPIEVVQSAMNTSNNHASFQAQRRHRNITSPSMTTIGRRNKRRAGPGQSSSSPIIIE